MAIGVKLSNSNYSHSPKDLLSHWSDWKPMLNAGTNKSIPSASGLYRVGFQNNDSLAYIGQTGRSLRERLGALSRGTYKDYMPYNDPHTAGPAFWAANQKENSAFEVSTCEISNIPTALRKGLECLTIYEHRIRFGFSPLFNFGRMPVGFSKSSGNNQKLVKSGKRFRGQRTSEILDCHEKGLPPLELIGNNNEKNFGKILNLNWSEWNSYDVYKDLTGSETGLYLFGSSDKDALLYIGEGKIRDRIKAHLKKGQRQDHNQYHFFKDYGVIKISFAINADLKSHHRLEIENDLIGAHIKKFNAIPEAQFIG
jgi:hypothetical protein